MFNFHKYQSLGNDFVLFDWMDQSSEKIDSLIRSDRWTIQVQQICDHHYGVGSDGILILRSTPTDPELLMFNPDGSSSETCFNGVRCAIDYLHTQKGYTTQFNLLMFGYTIQCEIVNRDNYLETRFAVDQPEEKEAVSIEIDNQTINGHRIDIGNHHFVIMAKTTPEWLAEYGPTIEQHPSFPNRTNIEFVWPADAIDGNPAFHLLVYERGCGLTLACGTGAAATLWTLHQNSKVSQNQPIYLAMPGGNLLTYIDKAGKVIQQAPTSPLFSGSLAKIK